MTETTQMKLGNESAAWAPPTATAASDAGRIVASFLDIAATSFGKATHYSSEAEVQAAERAAHGELLELDRDLYAAFLTLPGVTDRSRQLGLRNLLSVTRGVETALMNAEQERELVYALVARMPPQRMLKLFDSFRLGNEEAGIPKINNARSRKLILRSILQSPKLDYWAVKYRDKIGRALTHALGSSTAGIVRSILSKGPDQRNAKEIKILREEIGRWSDDARRAWLHECVGFTLGAKREAYSVELFQRFEAAKQELAAGKGLPIEVLEGIRGQHHADIPSSIVLELGRDTLSKGQKLATQRKAKEAGVEVKLDPTSYDPVRLYVFAFEMGLTDAIAAALAEKAKRAASSFPLDYRKLGVLVDASRSMFGDETQKLRPMATTLALRDMLAAVAEDVAIEYVGGQPDGDRLVRPQGETGLAHGLLALVEHAPEAVFVLSDGYENAPAGRFAEVVRALRRAGIDTPIHHLNPVVAAESGGVRELAPGIVATMPVSRPDALGLSILRHVLASEPVRAINALLNMTPALSPRKEA